MLSPIFFGSDSNILLLILELLSSFLYILYLLDVFLKNRFQLQLRYYNFHYTYSVVCVFISVGWLWVSLSILILSLSRSLDGEGEVEDDETSWNNVHVILNFFLKLLLLFIPFFEFFEFRRCAPLNFLYIFILCKLFLWQKQPNPKI